MGSPRTAAATRSEYVQARLDAILARADQAPVHRPGDGGGVVEEAGSRVGASGTVLTARRRVDAELRPSSGGPPRRSRETAPGRSPAAQAALAAAAVPPPSIPPPSIAPPSTPAPSLGAPSTGATPSAVLLAAAAPDGYEPVAADPVDADGPADAGEGGGHPDDRTLSVHLPRLTRRHLGVLATVLALAVAFSTFLLLRAQADSEPVALPSASPVDPAAVPPGPSTGPDASAAPSTQGSGEGSGEETPAAEIVVHVLGAVAEPGVVTLPEGSRVVDAVEQAGGFTAEAEPGELNLAQVLADGQQVVAATEAEDSTVRDPGGGGPASSPEGQAPGGDAAAGEPLDLNSATAAQLEELPGVGPVTAEKILAWREEHGGFSRVEELQEVSGIGPKTYTEIAPHVRV